MKTLYAVAFLFFECISTVTAQYPNWQWAKSAASADEVDGIDAVSISIDSNRNVFVTGTFYGGTVTFGNTTLINNAILQGGGNIFIVKYDSSGSVIWAKSAGGTNNDFSYGVSTDVKGNAYVTGSFEDSTIIFGNITLTNAGFVNQQQSGEDMFIVKYDASGNVVWAKNTGGSGGAVAFGISTDANCNAFITGHFFKPSVSFGGIVLTNTSDTDYFFIAKYDSYGNVVWAKSAGAIGHVNDTNGHNSISTDSDGHVYAMGVFTSPTITFGADILTNNSLGLGGNIFIVKYDSFGNAVWAKSAGEPNMSTVQGFSSLCTDSKGNAYVTGSFTSPTISFGTTTLTDTSAALCDGNNIFIAKYDSSGDVVWAKGEGGTGSSSIVCLSTDGKGNTYITGGFDSPTFTIGSNVLINNALPCGGINIFIAKYDSSGNVVWAQSAGGTNNDFSTAISTDGNGNGYIVGAFRSPTIAFGGTTLTNDSTGFFIAKFDNSVVNGIVNEADASNRVNVYPNPSNGDIYFNGIKNGYVIEVYDLLGESIYTANTSGVNYGMNLTEKARGIYFYRIIENTEIIQEGKIILE